MRRTQHSPSTPRRGGAVIIVVISLMTTMVVLGLFFYNWTNQERANAELFANSRPLEVQLTPIFDAALDQVIVGARPGFEQSVLEGSEHSMLAKILGRPLPNATTGALEFEASSRAGRGIQVTANGGGTFGLDYNGDGGASHDQTDFILNYSAAANGGTHHVLSNSLLHSIDYTYPDINNLFLGFDGFVPDGSAEGLRVVIPSFFRPQLFTPERTSNFSNLYTAAARTNAVFRPHQQHTAGGVVRFLNAPTIAQSGDRTRLLTPFPFQLDDVNGNGIANEFGVFSFTGGAVPPYEYDGDVDRDGIRDSILMDLGHPLIDLPGGQQVVPLYMMKWIDADGLLNVNAHGNLAAMDILGETLTDGTGWRAESLSRSNMGLGMGEVNLGMAFWANLSADFANPGDLQSLLRNYSGMFNFNSANAPSGAPTVPAMSNMELINLLNGRYSFDFDGDTLSSNVATRGRWGGNETILSTYRDNVTRMMLANTSVTNLPTPFNNQHPNPGQIGVNDNAPDFDYLDFGDATPTVYASSQAGQPIDRRGVGRVTLPGGDGARRALLAPAGDAVKYPAYSEHYSLSQYSLSPHAAVLAPSPLAPPIDRTDEPEELLLEPGLRSRLPNGNYDPELDGVFEPSELFSLQGSRGDLRAAGTYSRLLELASYNLRDNFRADRIRHQLTTDSWDRLEFSPARSLESVGSPTPFYNRSWEFNDWAISSNAFASPFGSNTGTDPLMDSDGAVVALNNAFPPAFGLVPVSTPESPQQDDPFRAVIRQALGNFAFSSPVKRSDLLAAGFRGQRLNLNRFLQDTTGADPRDGGPLLGLAGMRGDGALNFRNLTPHEGGLPLAIVDRATYPQEWQARLDRQQMARDIYVLLYVFCGGRDDIDYTLESNAGRAVYTDEQLEEMAQFAVNVVDALDPDDVITVFEYDRDLSDGWNLDDNAFDDMADTAPAGDRGVVYGVEAQTLTLSECLFVRTESGTSSYTEWDDTNPRTFAFVELRNARPVDIDFALEAWEIRLVAENVSTPHSMGLVLKQGQVSTTAGGLFTIGSTSDETLAGGAQAGDATANSGSRLRLDPAGGSNYATIVPASGSLATADHAIDLIDASMGVNNQYYIVNYNGNAIESTKGTWFPVNVATELEAGATGMNPARLRVQLRRKVSLDREIANPGTAEEADNPWVVVDEMLIDEIPLGTNRGGYRVLDGASAVASELALLKSCERPQPFDRRGEQQFQNPATAPSPRIDNTFGQMNQHSQPVASDGVLNDGFTLWQPHFDRDFTSKYELFSIPLYGPNQTTNRLAEGLRAGARMSGLDNNTQPAIAGARFTSPMLDPASGYNPDTDQRWYRLLEFLEVYPLELDRMRMMTPSVRRTPGRVNLNTIRDEAVLAGLIDDEQITGLAGNPLGLGGGALMTQDVLDANRNWFQELLIARDGVDPITSLAIPGTPGARPFRSGAYIEPVATNDEDFNSRHQLLRNHSSVDQDDRFGLLEARTLNDVGTDTVDYHTRERLLAKIANHATNRSHVFAGWIEVQFHEAHQLASGAVQVGGRAEGLPTYRMFCVVDMSRLEEAYDPATNTYDFRKFIIHRQLLP